MITIDFDSKGSLSLTEHIYSSIKEQILNGTLKAKEKLPSKRALAEHLKVSVITTQNAYGQLISEGYIYSIEKKGFFVTDISVEGAVIGDVGVLRDSGDSPSSQRGQPSLSAGTALTVSGDSSHRQWGQPSLSEVSAGTALSVSGDTPARQRGQTSLSAVSAVSAVSAGTTLSVSGDTPSPTPSLNQQNTPLFCDMISNSTAEEKFPFTLWAHTMRQVLNSGDQMLLQKQSVKGVLELRKAIARYLKSFRGMEVEPEQIVIGAGTESLYSMLVQFLGRNSIFAVENPGYHKVASIIQLNGAHCIPVKMDSQGISMELLEKSNANVVHVSPNHHFPTGTVMPVRRRRELLAWSQNADSGDSPLCQRGQPSLSAGTNLPVNGDTPPCQQGQPSLSAGTALSVSGDSPSCQRGQPCLPTGTPLSVSGDSPLCQHSTPLPRMIIEDEYDSEFRFTGKPIPTLQSQDAVGTVIYINTFSKTLSPSFRISYMVLPKQMVEQFQEKLGFFTCPVSAFEQYTLARFIQEGNYEKHIIRMKNYYRNLRNELIGEIQKSSLKKIATIREQESGLHFILHIESDLDVATIKQRLLSQGINLNTLQDFYYGKEDEEAGIDLVINYSGIKKQSIPELVNRFEKSLF